jgi:serine/threonine-protein kinase RsbW
MNGAILHQIALGPNAVSDGLAAARSFALAERLGAAEDVLALIVEELLCNLIDHGDAPAGDPIGMRLARTAEGIDLELISGGTPFDPRQAAHGPVPARGGGAGLALVRAWSRILSSDHIGDRNHLRLLIPIQD